MKPFTIAGISFWPELWQPRKNTAQLLRHLRTAAEMGAEVVATCEGVLDGYITRDLAKHKITQKDKDTPGFARRVARFRQRQLKLADALKATYIPAVRAEAAKLGLWVFLNTLDRRRGTNVYNTTFVIDPAGQVVGTYDKVHAAFEVVNTLGRAYPVFETPYAPIGVVICADRQYPETARSAALGGAEVLIINSYGMWGVGENERFIRQRAYENGMFVLFCHPGETVLVDPAGRIIAATCEWENVVVRRIDPSQAVGRGVFGTPEMAKTYNMSVDAYARLHRRTRASQKKKAKPS